MVLDKLPVPGRPTILITKFSLWIDCDHLDAPAGISSRSLINIFYNKAEV